LERFRGTFLQNPPAYSAKRIAGRRSYKAARASERDGTGPLAIPAAASVTAHGIDVMSVDGDRISVRVHCSAGFYVRSLAHDLGRALALGAHLEQLRRIRSGTAEVSDAVPLALVERDRAAGASALIPLARMLPEFRAVVLTDEGVRRAVHGRNLGPSELQRWSTEPCEAGPLRLLDRHGDLVGLAEPAESPGILHPCVVLM
jgi:tRNA pseudouridine55 synthase